MNIKQALPWQVKILAKIALSRLPFDYRVWQRLNLFKHGDMEQPEYAHNVFLSHFNRVGFSNKSASFTVLELGPGDTLFSALVAWAYGASRCYLVDEGRFARGDMAPYLKMAIELRSKGLPVPTLENCGNLDEVLLACKSCYLTEGMRSFQAIANASVDFIWSQAVLEHIRLKDFPVVVREMRRVLRPGGVCSHRVDLKDHLGGAINNLRFPARVWESNFMAKSGFYTNRIRYREMLGYFEAAGFEVEVCHLDRWGSLPTPRSKLSSDFSKLADDDLLVSGFDVILRPR